MIKVSTKPFVNYVLIHSEPRAIVIFLPGTGASPVFYHPFLLALRDKGFTVVGYDYPGHGPRAGTRGDFTVSEVMTELNILVKELREVSQGLPIVVMGSSMGGIMALYAAFDVDGIAAAVCHNAMLIVPSTSRLPFLIKWPVRAIISLIRFCGDVFSSTKIPTALYVRWRYVFDDPDRLREFQTHPWYVPKYTLRAVTSLFSHAPEEWQEGVKIPSLVITGEKDRVVPVVVNKRAAKAAGEKCTLKILKGAGHMLPIEYQQEFLNEVCNWLDECLP